MWCASTGGIRKEEEEDGHSLRLHTVVEQPLSLSGRGKIHCHIETENPPVTIEWEGPRGSPVQTDDTGSTAFGIHVGEYRIRATDSLGRHSSTKVLVEPSLSSPVVVTEYRVGGTSTSESRDGFVEAMGDGLDEGWRFLWTHGWITDTPLLRDVPTGTYTVTPLSKKEGGTPPVTVHMCAPAQVRVGRGFGER